MILVPASDLYLRNFILRNEMQTETASENLALSFPVPVYVSVFDNSTCPFLPDAMWKADRTSTLSSKQLFLDQASVHLPRTIWQSYSKFVLLTYITAIDEWKYSTSIIFFIKNIFVTFWKFGRITLQRKEELIMLTALEHG